MGEKIYDTVKSSGIMNIVAGVFAIAVGASALIRGIRLLKTRTNKGRKENDK